MCLPYEERGEGLSAGFNIRGFPDEVISVVHYLSSPFAERQECDELGLLYRFNLVLKYFLDFDIHIPQSF